MEIMWVDPEDKGSDAEARVEKKSMASGFVRNRMPIILLALAVLLYAPRASYEASSMYMEGMWTSSVNNIYNSNTGGNVGIGTDFTPTTNWPNSLSPSPLTVVSPDTTNNSTKAIATFYENDQKLGVGIASNHIFETGTNSNNSLYIDAQGTGNLLLQSAATGEVQIGTTNGNRELEVYGMVYSHDLNNNSGYISDSTNGYGGNFAGTSAGVYSQNVSSTNTTHTLLNYSFAYNNANYNDGVYSTGDICMNIGGGDHSSDICLSALAATLNGISKVPVYADSYGTLTINSTSSYSTSCCSSFTDSNGNYYCYAYGDCQGGCSQGSPTTCVINNTFEGYLMP